MRRLNTTTDDGAGVGRETKQGCRDPVPSRQTDQIGSHKGEPTVRNEGLGCSDAQLRSRALLSSRILDSIVNLLHQVWFTMEEREEPIHTQPQGNVNTANWAE